MMLSRIFSLSILCASLLFAGVPAIACAAPLPTQDCCPNGPQTPCELGDSGPADAKRATACCASGLGASTAIAAAASSDDIQKHSDSAPIITAEVRSAVEHRQSAYYVPAASPHSFNSSQRALYLSTGRLRL
jgi:hypothetical protein